MKSVAIHQPNFLPWIGYFHKINEAEDFVLLDDVQYVKQSPSSRNFIKNKNGEKYLLVLPVKKKNYTEKNYNEIEIDYAQPWQKKHLNIIKDSYFHSLSFKEIFSFIENIYSQKFENLASLNIAFIEQICKFLEIKTNIILSSELAISPECIKNERNIAICKQLHATHYLSGIGAKKYNQEILFHQNNLKLIYQNYTPIIYAQINGTFIPNLSIIDYLFNVSKSEYSKIFN
jgi:hypothetical protein